MGSVENLLSLKCLLFVFFGGLGCLLPGLALAGPRVGLYASELYLVSAVAPLVALLGPLVIAPLADRLGAPAQGSTARYGRCMRALLVTVAVFGAVLYSALLYVPPVSRLHERNPPVSFFCSPEGAVVMQDQCHEVPCYPWPENNRGTLFLSSCRYVCSNGPITPEGLLTTQVPPNATDEDDAETQTPPNEEEVDDITNKEMPHLCVESNGQSICHVYTHYSRQLAINLSLIASTPPADTSQWCSYKTRDKVTCKVPTMTGARSDENCTVVCDLDDPYNGSHSLLLESECRHTSGDPELTFWAFLVLRSVADIFPTTAIALLASCLVVVARDTPAVLCRQLIFALLGFTFFPPIVEFVVDLFPTDPLPDQHTHAFGYYILTFAFLSIVSALILLFSRSLPLSPVDYQLQGPGPLTLRGSGGEAAALSLVLMLLGLLSCAIDSYIPWESVFLALIPSLLVLWYSDRVVNYCGHSNLLILAFTLYIIRYTGLLVFEEVWALFLLAALEVFTLVLSWSTAFLYLRHLVPRNFLVSGQAMAIVAFFCLGRCLGSVLGGLLIEHNRNPASPKWNDYESYKLYSRVALFAAIIASVYFALYHCFLKHRWRKQSTRVAQPVARDTNANGTYTPLKIYNPPAKDQRIRY